MAGTGRAVGRHGKRSAIARTVAVVAAAVVLAVPALAVPAVSTVPAATQPADRTSVGSGLTITSPRHGATIRTRGLEAAERVHLRAAVRVARDLQDLSVRLNGELVPSRRSGRTVVARLTPDVGLEPGVNRLRVTAVRRGTPVPVSTVSQFTITYPSRDLLQLALQRGADGHAVRPRLRLPAGGIASLSVTLNGRDVASALRRAEADGTRALEASAAEGLRWGRNRLQVRVVMRDGRTETETATFRLDRRRSLAGVRLVGDAHVGEVVRLDAGSSRVARGRLDRSSVRWALVSRPADSSTSVPAQGKRISWTPDAPGTYVVRVTVGRGTAASSATLSVSVTYASLLVALDTIDAANGSALTIGSNHYAVTAPIQVTVLDRANLQRLDSRGFGVASSDLSALGTYLKGLKNTELVFVTHPSSSPTVAFNDIPALNTALGYIGGAYPHSWTLNMTSCWAGATNYCYTDNTGWYHTSGMSSPAGSFTVAGVPGMQVGQAWRATAVQSKATEGRITGYLSPGVPGATGASASWVITAGAEQYVQVDTCASGAPDACVIRVGDQTFAPTPGANGFNVVTLDRTTLTPLGHVTATTSGQLTNALLSVAQVPIGRQLAPPNFMDDQRIAVVQSVGTGILPASTSNPYPYLDQLGATPELVAASSTPGGPDAGTRYAMVGVADDLPWHGTATESSPLVSDQQTGRLRTILSRDRDQRLTPTTGDPYGQTNLDLFSVMYQDPTPWLYVGDPAVSAIAAQLDLPSDIRSAYTSAGVDFGSKGTRLVLLTCATVPGCGTTFTEADFTAVQGQLADEFDYVMSTRDLIASLKEPLYITGGAAPVYVEDVYDEISATVKPPPTTSSSFGWLDMFDDVTNLAASIAFAVGTDGAGVALGLVSATGSFATEFTSTPSGDSADTLSGKVDDLDTQIVDQQTAYAEALGQLEDILLTDAGKLATVGVSVGTDPAWYWDEDTSFSEAVTALNATSRATSYTTLLPAAWGMWNLKPDNETQLTSDDVKKYYCLVNSNYPPVAIPVWEDAPDGNVLHAVTSVAGTNSTTPPPGTVVSQVWTFSNVNTGSFAKTPASSVTVPDVSLTDNLTSTSTLDGAFQDRRQWIRSTYDPPGHLTCSTSDAYPSSAKVPPAIPNASAAATQ